LGFPLEFYITADNDGPLFYKYQGAGVKDSDYIETSGQLYTTVPLSNGEGLKSVEILLRDDAENFCPPAKFSIEVDHEYLSSDLFLDADAMWTLDEYLIIRPHFDHFSHVPTEMYISGGVIDTPETNEWIDFSKEVAVRLTPTNGHRSIDISYRNAREREASVTRHIFLRPFVQIQGSLPEYTLILSPFHQLKHLSISGCAESYSQVPFAFSVTCTPAGDTVSVIYTMTDDTFVTVSESF